VTQSTFGARLVVVPGRWTLMSFWFRLARAKLGIQRGECRNFARESFWLDLGGFEEALWMFFK
jgi:hypothetical protein